MLGKKWTKSPVFAVNDCYFNQIPSKLLIGIFVNIYLDFKNTACNSFKHIYSIKLVTTVSKNQYGHAK